jgi:hypothetical protein
MLPSPDPMQAEQHFAAALTADNASLPSSLVTRPGARPQDRFGIHRNNVAASLGAVLRARFPAIERLVGDAFFALLALEFFRAHPPKSPVLLEYGAAMPDFLMTFSPVAQLPYLPDVARLEWLGHVALHAADATPLDPATLAAVAPVQMEGLRFDLHPSLSVVASSYPIVSIWRANIGPAPVAPIAADLPAESALVLRPHLETVVHAITSPQALFVDRLLAGDPLCIAADEAGSDIDLTMALTLLLRAGAITGFHLASSNPNRS